MDIITMYSYTKQVSYKLLDLYMNTDKTMFNEKLLEYLKF